MFRVAVLCVVVTFSSSLASAQEDPQAILNAAIAATAGKDGKLEKLRLSNVLLKGIMYTANGELAVMRKIASDWPKKCRSDFMIARGEGEVRVTVVVDGDSAWRKVSGMAAVDAPPEELEVYQGDTHAMWVATLLPLKDKAFTLTPLPAAKIQDAPAVGFKAAYPNRPDVSLYFDKKSALLVRVLFKGKEAGVLILKDTYLTEHKEVDGLMLPTKQVDYFDRKKTCEWKLAYEFVDKLDKEIFAKP